MAVSIDNLEGVIDSDKQISAQRLPTKNSQNRKYQVSVNLCISFAEQ